MLEELKASIAGGSMKDTLVRYESSKPALLVIA